jgi:hypothetical protein
MAKAYAAQFNALDLQLEVITCASQSDELGEAWDLLPGLMAEAFRLPYKDELASQYFNVFEADKPC